MNLLDATLQSSTQWNIWMSKLLTMKLKSGLCGNPVDHNALAENEQSVFQIFICFEFQC